MLPEFIQPARSGSAFTFESFKFSGQFGDKFPCDHEVPSQVMPINLSPEEIREMVHDILG